jgi:hypothetical protein
MDYTTLLRGYQPVTTPYPRGPGYAIGAGVNTLAQNLIMAALYQREEERRQREEAIQKLGVLTKLPGAMRTPAARQIGQQAGFGVDFSALPETEDELKARALRSFMERYPQYMGMPSQMIEQQMKQDWFGELMNRFQTQGGLAGGEPPVPQMPPTAPPTGTGVTEERVGPMPRVPELMTEESMSISPSGPTITRKQVPRPGASEENRRIQMEELSRQIRQSLIAEINSGRSALPAKAKALGVDINVLVDATVNDQLRGRAYSISAEAPSLHKLVGESQARQRAENDAKRTDAIIASNEQSVKRLDELIRSNQVNEATRLKQIQLDRLNHQIGELQSVMKQFIGEVALPGTPPEELLKNPVIAEYAKQIRQLQEAADRIAGINVTRSLGVPPGAIPPNWLKKPGTRTPGPTGKEKQAAEDAKSAFGE